MVIHQLKRNPAKYTCCSYLITGDFKTLKDANTLIDVGMDSYILEEIRTIYTGVGKSPVEKVVLTHGHFDHAAGLKDIVAYYKPRVYSLQQRVEWGPTDIVADGDVLLLGDRDFEIIHTPGHSNDSLCLYCKKDKVLFSGDMPLRLRMKDTTYGDEVILSLDKLARRDIQAVYTGHDGLINSGVNEMIHESLRIASHSKL